MVYRIWKAIHIPFGIIRLHFHLFSRVHGRHCFRTARLLLRSYSIVSCCQLCVLEPCSGQWPNFEEASFGWWSMKWAAIDDVVSCLFWLATLTCCTVRQSPLRHRCSRQNNGHTFSNGGRTIPTRYCVWSERDAFRKIPATRSMSIGKPTRAYLSRTKQEK